MPAGTYHLYADVVFRNGFPETETTILTVPAEMTGAPLGKRGCQRDAAANIGGTLGTGYKLPDGYMMEWEKPAALTANTPYKLIFHLLDPQGKPAADMQPYLGMAGTRRICEDRRDSLRSHASRWFGCNACSNAGKREFRPVNEWHGGQSAMNMSTEPVSPMVAFPYGFPSAERIASLSR